VWIAGVLELVAFATTAWLLSCLVDWCYRTAPGEPPAPPRPDEAGMPDAAHRTPIGTIMGA
jgi:hypothetical protein